MEISNWDRPECLQYDDEVGCSRYGILDAVAPAGGGGHDPLWRNLLDAHESHVCLMDLSGRIFFVNRAWRLFAQGNGYDPSGGAGVGRNYRDLCVASATPEASLFATMFDKVVRGVEPSQEMLYACHSPDEKRWFCLQLMRVPGSDMIMAIHSNVSALKTSAEMEIQASLVDEVTGTLSRRGFIRAVDSRLALQPATLVVVVMSIEDFPRLATQHGRSLAEDMVRRLVARLRACVPLDCLIGHVGGRDLALALPHSSLGSSEASWAGDLANLLAEPVAIGSRYLRSAVHCGVALSRRGEDVPAVLKRADLALGEARRQGLAAEVFSGALQDAVTRQVVLTDELREAIPREQLALSYQPQMDGVTGRLIGMEALLRWRHPELGAISPAEFVPIAEANGLMGMLTTWVIDTACRQVAQWKLAGLATVPVAVNVSGSNLKTPGFAESLIATVAMHGLEPTDLELELTESVLVSDDNGRARQAIRSLQRGGFTFAIDDFGTGYCNMAYLRHLPLRKLKMDRSFVKDIHAVPETAALAEAIINVARALAIEPLAEGVECSSERDKLMALGCTKMQGYLLARPSDPEVIAALLGAEGGIA